MGKLEVSPENLPAIPVCEARARKSEVLLRAPIFLLRLMSAGVACAVFFMYTWAGFSGDEAYNVFLSNLEGEPFLRTWKMVVLAAPWLLTAGLIFADMGAVGIALSLVLSTVWGGSP